MRLSARWKTESGITPTLSQELSWKQKAISSTRITFKRFSPIKRILSMVKIKNILIRFKKIKPGLKFSFEFRSLLKQKLLKKWLLFWVNFRIDNQFSLFICLCHRVLNLSDYLKISKHFLYFLLNMSCYSFRIERETLIQRRYFGIPSKVSELKKIITSVFFYDIVINKINSYNVKSKHFIFEKVQNWAKRKSKYIIKKIENTND